MCSETIRAPAIAGRGGFTWGIVPLARLGSQVKRELRFFADESRRLICRRTITQNYPKLRAFRAGVFEDYKTPRRICRLNIWLRGLGSKYDSSVICGCVIAEYRSPFLLPIKRGDTDGTDQNAGRNAPWGFVGSISVLLAPLLFKALGFCYGRFVSLGSPC